MDSLKCQQLILGTRQSFKFHHSFHSKIAGLSIDEFLEILKETVIDVVDYPENEVDTDLDDIL
ncbi:MAG: hypothetical protein JSV88_23470 [Candidatus Aminicenantes bacterium]|nr:MAG: hypothetical protein JSV88_23470 [Candidatus Aminicenantes bacterium]